MKYGQTIHTSDRTTRCECSVFFRTVLLGRDWRKKFTATEGAVAECATTSSDGVEEMHLPTVRSSLSNDMS